MTDHERSSGSPARSVTISPQPWAAGTPLMLLQSSLGLEFDQDRNEILLRERRLPAFLEEVTLRNLRLVAMRRAIRVSSPLR